MQVTTVLKDGYHLLSASAHHPLQCLTFPTTNSVAASLLVLVIVLHLEYLRLVTTTSVGPSQMNSSMLHHYSISLFLIIVCMDYLMVHT